MTLTVDNEPWELSSMQDVDGMLMALLKGESHTVRIEHPEFDITFEVVKKCHRLK